MFGLGMWEIVLILVIVLIIFGVGKLPEIGSGLGEGIRNFRKSLKEPSDTNLPEHGDSNDTEEK